MKKVLCLLLCLMLTLAAPLSALAEPQSWLLPFVKRGDTVQSGEAVMTVQADPEAVLAVVDRYYDRELESYEELAKSWAEYYEEQEDTAEETDSSAAFYDSYIKSMKQSLNTARATAKAYIPAAAALADASEILIRSGEGISGYEFRVDGNSWFTLNLISRPEEGDALLTSDLFPSCALSLPQVEAQSNASAEGVQKLLGVWQELLPTLPDYEGFDLLGQAYEANVQILNLLEAEGLAHREGDALVYEHTVSLPGIYDSIPNETLDALYQRRAMDVDERLYRLYDLINRVSAAVSSTPAAYLPEVESSSDILPVLGENATDEEYENAFNEYALLMYGNRTQTTTQTQRVVLENGEITNEITVTVSTHYEPLNDETGTVEKLLERYEYLSYLFEVSESKMLVAARFTPTALEYRRMPNDYTEERIRLDISAENEIVLSYTTLYHYSGSEDEEEVALLRLTRTDEGQQWTLSMEMLPVAEPLRITLSLDNDVTRMDLGVSMLGKDLGNIHAEYAYSDEPAPVPDVSGLTVIPNGDAEAMKALYAELRAVAVPKLTKLITTGLPKGAQGLIVPLLGAVAALGQMGK
ncbi:MAG: hypothetical protein IKP72_08660 [Clostridia bacterium]|nr:hypothetical protein [Clostridia bacterium]